MAPAVRSRTDARRCETSCREHARTRRPVKAESPEGNVAPRGTSPRREGWCGFDCGGENHQVVVLSPMSAPGQTPADAGRAVGSTRERGGWLRQSRPEGKVAPRGTSPRREGWCGFDCGGVSHQLVVLSPSSAQDSRPQMRDELSRARARWNRRPQMRASCPARAANGAPKGERPGGQRWAGWFFSKRPLARKQLRRANGDWSQRPISSLRCSTNKYKRP